MFSTCSFQAKAFCQSFIHFVGCPASRKSKQIIVKMGSTTVPSLQLPTFTPLEPLTNGTNLPTMPTSELAPPEPYHSERAIGSSGTEKPSIPSSSHDHRDESAISPPASPGRPTSVRRFLSRVSLNSSYNTNGNVDDQSSIFSSPTSLSSPEGKKKSKSGKTSWWKKVRRQSAIIPSSSEITAKNGSIYKSEPAVQPIPPPPRLPDDMFGSNLSSLDGDMFKNLK